MNRSTAMPVSKMRAGVPGVTAAAQTRTADNSLYLLALGHLVVIALEYSGIDNDLGVLKAIRLSTLLHVGLTAGVLWKCGVGSFFSPVQLRLCWALWSFTVLSLLYAEVQGRSLVLIRPLFMLIACFAVVTSRVVDRQQRIDRIAMVLVPITTLLVVRNADTMRQARLGGLASSYFMGDQNDFAWGMVVMLPIIAILLFGQRRLVTRLLGVIGVGACVAGIVLSGSRGGALALTASFLYFWWFVSTRRTLGMAAALTIALSVFVMAPAGYFERIETIATYEEDNSAIGRLEAWSKATQMALDYPLGVGAGNFPSAYGRYYRNLETTHMRYGAARWISPHSIYFRTLGEFGFLGLTLLIWLIVACFRDNVRSARLLRAQAAPRVDRRWPLLLNMSIIGFATAGTFLGGEYPHLFLLTGLTVATKRMAMAAEEPVREDVKGRQTAAGVPAANRQGWPAKILVPANPHAIRQMPPRPVRF